MGLSNCPKCGNLFNKMTTIPFCPRCIEEEQQAEDKIKNYLRSNPDSQVADIARGTKLKERVVREVLKKDSFQKSGYRVGYPCEVCGTEIRGGKVCQKCSMEMKSDMANIQERLAKKQSKPGFLTSKRLKR